MIISQILQVAASWKTVTMPTRDLLRALRRLGRPRILVLGDVMLDRYTRGDASRISPEAPVVVLRAGASDERLGGAANVANMLGALQAEVVCGGVVGADDAGRTLHALWEASGVDPALVMTDPARPTTVKERFIGLAATRHASQLLRVDRESTDPLPAALESQVVARLAPVIRHCSALLISDYGKGFCTPALLRAAIDEARRRRVPVLVDPAAWGRYERYRGATLLKPNRREAEQAAGEVIATPQDALRVGQKLCRETEIGMAVVTLDRDGMALAFPEEAGLVFPTRAREVYDITGAGDMVLAMLGLSLAEGAPPSVAVRLANIAAGLEVEREGVAVIAREEIRRQITAGSSHRHRNGGAAPKLALAKPTGE